MIIDRIKIGNTDIAIDDSCAVKDPVEWEKASANLWLKIDAALERQERERKEAERKAMEEKKLLSM